MTYKLTTEKTWSETERAVRETFRKWGVTQYEILGPLHGVQASRWNQTHEDAEVAVNFKHPESGAWIPVASKDQARAVDNFRVVYLALEAIRLNEMRGIAEVVREAYMALPAPVKERDPYEVLGVRPDAPVELIESAYRLAAKKAHPDAGGSDEAMRQVNAAYERVKASR